MKYIVQVDGKEFGPVDEITLVQWAEEGRILRQSKVRNALIMKWNDASTLDFLATPFAERDAKVHPKKSGFGGFFTSLAGGEDKTAAKDALTFETSTSFKQHYLPNPAPISLRLMAALFDFIVCYLILMLAAIPGFLLTLLGLGNSTAFHFSFFLAFCGVVCYLAGCIGVFAQTAGMWFWGIMLSRHDNKATSVYLFRAYAYTLLMLALGVFAPLIIYLNGEKRSLHEILTGTQVIRIAAKPKA